MNPPENSTAFGVPGTEPRWTSSAKEGVGNQDLGGYHLVWTRDLVHSAMALLATAELHSVP
jgi:hypothetical protein